MFAFFEDRHGACLHIKLWGLYLPSAGLYGVYGVYMESTNISVWDVARSELNFETPLTRISWRFYPHLPALHLAKRNNGICANCPGMLLFLYLKWNQGNKLCQDDPGGLELWSLGTTQLVRVLLDFKKTNSFMSIHMEFFLNGNKCFSLHSKTTLTG